MAVSDKPWSQFSQADYTPQQWAKACLIDTGVGAADSKARYKLPVLEPSGALNRAGCHAAAGRIHSVTGVSADLKKAAAKKLVGLYKSQLKEDPPSGLLSMAGMSMNSAKMEKYATREVTVPFDVAENDGLNFSGYAAVFNSPTVVHDWLGDFTETIKPGAFTRTLSEKTPVLMFNHGRHPLIGDMPLGTITDAREDMKGLFVEARLTDNWLIRPVRDAVDARAITGMSFRFSVPEGGDKWNDDESERELLDINVPELGPVVFPQYEPTTASVRSILEHIEPKDDELLDLCPDCKARRLSARSTDGGRVKVIGKETLERSRQFQLRRKVL